MSIPGDLRYHYLLESVLGSGRFATVYRAREIGMGRMVALKLFDEHVDLERFSSVVAAWSRLRHRNITRVFAHGVMDGQPFIAMERHDGVSLRTELSKGAIAPRRVLTIVAQCCAALAEAHANGVLHGDLRPEQVFVLNRESSPDLVKLLDVGLVSLFERARAAQYMSPEQVAGTAFDARSDLYALGIMMFELLTGRPPFDGDDLAEVLHKQQSSPVPALPGGLPLSVQDIVYRAVDKDPGRRYQIAIRIWWDCNQALQELDGRPAAMALRTSSSSAARAREQVPEATDDEAQDVRRSGTPGPSDTVDDDGFNDDAFDVVSQVYPAGDARWGEFVETGDVGELVEEGFVEERFEDDDVEEVAELSDGDAGVVSESAPEDATTPHQRPAVVPDAPATLPPSYDGQPQPRNRLSLVVGVALAGAAAAGALIASFTLRGSPGASEGGMIAVGALGAAGAGALGARRVASAGGALVRRSRAALAGRATRRLVQGARSVRAQTPPRAMAYRPSWVLPRRQSAIHVYVVLPEVEDRVDREAKKALDAPGNPARKSHTAALLRALEVGERLAVHVELADFDIGEVAPVAWQPPYVRFLVAIRAHAHVAPGIHRPIVTIRCADALGELTELLARFDFDLEVRVNRRMSSRRGAMVAGCAVLASATLTATAQHSLPGTVGWPLSAACIVGGAGTWAMQRTAMVQAEVRDQVVIAAAYAPEDRQRVQRAILLLQGARQCPEVDVDRVMQASASAPLAAFERADRVFVFWSDRARASSEVTRAWQAAVRRAQDGGGGEELVTTVVLGPEELDRGHPLQKFDVVDLGDLADALIVTAVKDEYDAVLAVDTGAVPGRPWQRRARANGLEVAFREFAVEGGVLRIAVTQALGMGGINAVDASARLIDEVRVRCLAMCGVCAGRRGDVELGDVIIADRLWQYDTGKRKVVVDAHGERTVREQGDIDMYKIQPPAWKHAAERFDLGAQAPWLAERPRSYAAQGEWILERVLAGADPARDAEQAERCPDYDKAIARLWARRLLVDGTLALTDAGRDHIARLLTLHRGRLPEPRPLRVHVGPIASGNKVIEDAEVFPLLADSVRKVLGVEMEAAAIGTIATTSQLPYSVVMKAVMDHADPDKSDNFKAFAARASAECLIAFLRKNLPPRAPAIP